MRWSRELRLAPNAGLVTHRITPDQLGVAYEGLLKQKEDYLGVVVTWK